MRETTEYVKLRSALAGLPVWLVGGCLRDELLGRSSYDLDLAVNGDVRSCANQVVKELGGSLFQLSDEFGTWRVVGPESLWQVDLSPLQGGSIEEDLSRRDFTVNAMARLLANDQLIDPYRGKEDLSEGRLQAVTANSFTDDPLRVLRLARFTCEFDLTPTEECLDLAKSSAKQLDAVAGERVFDELKGIVKSKRVVQGVKLLDNTTALNAVLPELVALKGVEQSVYHHLDVFEHTLSVVDQLVQLEDSSLDLLESSGRGFNAQLDQELADGLTRWQGLRFGALLHDIAKPSTRKTIDGKITFYNHDALGAEVARDILKRLKTSMRLIKYTSGLVRNHLRLGYLTHKRPLQRQDLYTYLSQCSPVEVDVTVLSVADRLATRGRGHEEATQRHLDLTKEIAEDTLRWQEYCAQTPLVRGDQLAQELSIDEGPVLGQLLKEIDRARYLGEVQTTSEAVEIARRVAAKL